MQEGNSRHIVLSRTDSIGDVVLSLPLCNWIKEQDSSCKITFIGTDYTQSVLEKYNLIDTVLSKDKLAKMSTSERNSLLSCDAFIHVFPDKQIAAWAKEAKAKIRVGTSHRAHHLWTCNKRVSFSRKNSMLHEAQLNFNLLKPLGLKHIPKFESFHTTTSFFKVKDPENIPFSIEYKKCIILHPKSKGSALEWPFVKYQMLAKRLVEMGYTVLFTGTEKEGLSFRNDIPEHSSIYDMTGKLSLDQFICLIAQCKALVACSTGPYHLAGLLGIRAIGLFSMRRPIFPIRWKAIGTKAEALVFDPNCAKCASGKHCTCIEHIETEVVLNKIQNA